MALYRPPVRLACDTIFTDTCHAMRTFVPILATLTLTVGLLLPVRDVARVRRCVGRSLALLQVDTGRDLNRPTALHQNAGSPAMAMPQSESGEAFTGPVVPVDSIAHSLESGWWLTPPARAVVRTQMTRSFCGLSGTDEVRLLLRDPCHLSIGACRAGFERIRSVLVDGSGQAVSGLQSAA